jgi:hypothetical protein
MTRYRIYPEEHLASANREEIEAWLAIERADLLAQLNGLDERILCEQSVMGDWTAKDLLSHVGNWDGFFAESVTMALAGRASEVTDVNMDERNAQVWAERPGWSLTATLEAFAAARAGFLEVFRPASPHALDCAWQFGWGSASLRRIARWRGYHDSNHADQISVWRKGLVPALPQEQLAGSKPVLAASLQAYRVALFASLALISTEEHQTRPVCGAWTLQDMIGHLADWERLCGEVVRQMAAGSSPALDYDGDCDAWNAAHAARRRGQPWSETWNDLEAARRTLLDLLDSLSPGDLNRPVEGQWGGTPYRWIHACLDHDREHTYDLGKLLGLIESAPNE